jgi:hypothetical protein
MVVKHALQKEIEEKATAEAKARGLNGYAASDLVCEAVDVIEDFFAYITWTKVADGTIQSKDSVTEWHHRQPHDFESDWKYLEFDREGLRNAAERYLERPWMQCSKMDWLILNVLTYAEYQAFVDQVRSRTMRLEDYVSLRTGGKVKSGTSFAVLGLIIAIALGLAWLWPPLGVAYAAGVCWQKWKQRKARKKIDALTKSMSATYSTFNTVSQSWKLVWDELLKGREQGVVWDGIVFRLAESRMTA